VKRILHFGFVVALVSVLGSCAVSTQDGGTAGSQQTGDLELVNRALSSMGGVEAMRALRSASIKGTVKHWEPEQSHTPGGEMRFAADSSFDLTLDLASQRARTDWEKKFAYPAPRTFKFTEVVAPDVGYVIGIDSNGRNAQSLQMKPPAHTMSGVRLTATQRELRRTSPALLLEMRGNPSRVQRVANITVGNVSYPALSYNAGSYTFIVMFDAQTGLPARVRTLDYDNMLGDVNYDLVLSDWRPLGDTRIAASQRYELDGRTVAEIRLTQMLANPALNPAGMSIPENMRATAARPATGNVPYQWVIRRQFIGTYLDSDNASFDMLAANAGLRLHELAPGVQHVVGGSHNALVVDMRDYLIVFDAPVSDWQSNWTIAAAQARYGAKQIRYLVLTHHHMDHAGGLRRYLAQGATLVVGRGTAAHYRKVLAAPATRNPDLAAYNFAKTNIIEVADKYVMNDGRREVSAHIAENPHVDGMLIGYVADARIGFVVDIWSPGAASLPNQITSPLAALVNATKRAGISPLRYAGGHGSTAEYAPLSGLAVPRQ
jgi:glyoxylase-like metal-dependent hydrolase (beta-lactamase superfamily II)